MTSSPSDAALQLQLDRPILIGGASSSGSTLLASFLSGHSQIYCGPEMSLFNKEAIFGSYSAFLRKLPKWLQRGCPTSGYSMYEQILPHDPNYVFSRQQLLEWAHQSSSLREFVDRLQRWCLETSGKTIFSEKTPSNAYCFRRFLELYPEATVVHPLRDGRDVVCSLKKRGYSLFQAASIWLYNTAAGLACREHPRYVEYKYEDLAAEPHETFRYLCDRLHVRFEPSALDQPAASAEKVGKVDSWQSKPTDPVNTRSVQRYRQELSDEELAAFYRVRLTAYSARQLRVSRWSTADVLGLTGYAIDESLSRPKGNLLAKLQAWKDFALQNKRSIGRRWGVRRRFTCVT